MVTTLSVAEVIARVTAVTQKPGWFRILGIHPGMRFYGKLRDGAFSFWVLQQAEFAGFASAVRVSGTITAEEAGAHIDLIFSCTESLVLESVLAMWAAILGIVGYLAEAAVMLTVVFVLHLIACFNYYNVRQKAEDYLLTLLDARQSESA